MIPGVTDLAKYDGYLYVVTCNVSSQYCLSYIMPWLRRNNFKVDRQFDGFE